MCTLHPPSLSLPSSFQIRYDSFSAPLRLLGCFSREVISFPDDATPTRSHEPSPAAFQTSGSFSNFEAEFKTWQQPSEHLQETSFVFCASEIFRFLRDMALDVLTGQSSSLLVVGGDKAGSRGVEKNFYGAPPVTSKRSKVGGGAARHLVHPGAVLCMMDLLPSVTVSNDLLDSGADQGSAVGRQSQSPSSGGRGMSVSPRAVSPEKSPTHLSEDSFYDAQEEPIEVATAVKGVGQGAESVEVVVERDREGNDMTEEEMKQVC